MRIPENINWELEGELININDCDGDNYIEGGWDISFDYNGYKLTATIDFTLDFKRLIEEETNTDDVEVVSVDVTIQKLTDEFEDVFELSTKEEIELENSLSIELNIEF
jgi:hypothetical protein